MAGTTIGSVVLGAVQKGWFEAINRLARDTVWLHAPAQAYAKYGVVLFAGLLLLAWWSARKSGDLARVAASLWAPVAMLVALGVNQFLVAAFSEPRPYTVLPNSLVLVSRSPDFSFPSDHAVMAGAVAVGVLLVHRQLGLLATGLGVLMAFARVYVGAHWPLDVVAGLLVGGAISWASYVAVRALAQRLVMALADTRLRVLLTSHAPRAA